jgi:hypothetical protein
MLSSTPYSIQHCYQQQACCKLNGKGDKIYETRGKVRLRNKGTKQASCMQSVPTHFIRYSERVKNHPAITTTLASLNITEATPTAEPFTTLRLRQNSTSHFIQTSKYLPGDIANQPLRGSARHNTILPARRNTPVTVCINLNLTQH